MSREVPYIVDQFRTIVDRVNTKVIATIRGNDMAITGLNDSLIKKVSYEHGHPKEVIAKLQQKDQGTTFKYKRYPLVALFEDIKYTPSNVDGCYANARITLVILGATSPHYVAEERYAKNFKPVLDVIYNELLIQIDSSAFYHIQEVSTIDIEMIRRLYWGKSGLYGNTGNIFNDYIDAIEVFLNLNVYYADACPDS